MPEGRPLFLVELEEWGKWGARFSDGWQFGGETLRSTDEEREQWP